MSADLADHAEARDMELERLLVDTARRCASYLQTVGLRQVAPERAALEGLAALGGPLPETPTPATDVITTLDTLASPATTATNGPRYFGLVIGGALPVTTAASWLAATWDQNVGVRAGSPMAAKLEEIALDWLRDLLRLPPDSTGTLVTGATMANFCGLAAARHALLFRQGWDVEALGLTGAPRLRIVVGGQVHASVLKALSMLGLGRDCVIRVPVDKQGRMIAEQLPALDDRTILCIQAGNVSTGAFDPAAAICDRALQARAWVHVDGAFGLWARSSFDLASLADGFDRADSWSVDAHKWLNVPYDSGIAFVRDGEHLRAAMAATADYLVATGDREPFHYTPEMSRRARAIEIWAAVRLLGRTGVAGLIDQGCRQAALLARLFSKAGYEVVNEVVLNQILVSFGSDAVNRATIDNIQRDGTCWCGGTSWNGRWVMRVSIASWSTSDDDIRISFEAMQRAAQQARAVLATRIDDRQS